MFPVKQRVPREIFKKVMTEGDRYSSGLFLLKRLENGLEYPRFGVIVSKKVAKLAVQRHKIKRAFCNCIRSEIGIFENCDYVFNVNGNVFEYIKENLSKEMKKISF